MSWEYATSHLIDSQRAEIARDAAFRKWEQRAAASLDTLGENARRIVMARLDRQMSQESAGREMGISAISLGRIENGRGNPSQDLIDAAVAWAVTPHPRDGMKEKRATEPKPRYQRPRSSDPAPVVRWVAPPPPPPPPFLISDRCPYWSAADVRITEATCADTRSNGVARCQSCPGIVEVSAR